MATSKRSETVLRQLFSDIISREKGHSGKLPSAQELSATYGISTASIREALKTLETVGIITLSHGKGIFVEDSDEIILDLLESRKVIEGHNATEAAIHRTTEDLAFLQDLYKRMDQAIKDNDIESYNSMDHEFHLAIAKLSKNKILGKVLDTLKFIHHYQLMEVNKVPSLLKNSHRYHGRILRAIAARDKESARAAMQSHLGSLISYWQKR